MINYFIVSAFKEMSEREKMVFYSSLLFEVPPILRGSSVMAISEESIGMRRGSLSGFVKIPCPEVCSSQALRKCVPLAASLAILLSTSSVNAGVLSGFSGLESIPGPQLPKIDFFERRNEENQQKYAELDKRFKSSPVLKELLERSRLNKQKNKKEIQDKYCLRGAEWGVGDCSTNGMTSVERENFIAMLKKNAAKDTENVP